MAAFETFRKGNVFFENFRNNITGLGGKLRNMHFTG